MTQSEFPNQRLRRFRMDWGVAQHLKLPLTYWRASQQLRETNGLRRSLSTKFGFGPNLVGEWIWLHIDTMGQLATSVPLLTALIDRGEQVVLTCSDIETLGHCGRQFAHQLGTGRLVVRHMVFDIHSAYARFFDRIAVKYLVAFEQVIWPEMVFACHDHGVPLVLCNAATPQHKRPRKHAAMADMQMGLAGVVAKSDTIAATYTSLGVPRVRTTGDLRFATSLSLTQIMAAEVLKQLNKRTIITLRSVLKAERHIYLKVIQDTRDLVTRPLFVWVPKQSDDFQNTAEFLANAGLKVALRSQLLSHDFKKPVSFKNLDVLVGDSIGDMAFYMGLADRIIIGGGFSDTGSHSMTEALVARKPTVIGPNIAPDAFPFHAAIAAKVCDQVNTTQTLVDICVRTRRGHRVDPALDKFLAAQSGCTVKTLHAISDIVRDFEIERKFAHG